MEEWHCLSISEYSFFEEPALDMAGLEVGIGRGLEVAGSGVSEVFEVSGVSGMSEMRFRMGSRLEG